jgi:hypothetical protein
MLSAGEAAQRILGMVSSQLSAAVASRQTSRFGDSAVAAAAGLSAGRLPNILKDTGRVSTAGLATAAEAMRQAEIAEKTGRGPDMQAAIVPLIAEVAESLKYQTPAGRR